MFADWPVWAAHLTLFLIAVARGGATYAVGRGLRHGASHSRLRERLTGPTVARYERLIGRYGAPVVAVAFLTVGVQTLVLATAGIMRMPLRRFIPGLLVGALFWATIYTTIGFAVIEAAFGRIPWWWALVAAALVAVIVVVSKVISRRGPGAGRVPTSGSRAGGRAATPRN